MMKQRKVFFELEKKEIELDIILKKFNTKYNCIQENQLNIEKNLTEKMNLIISEQRALKEEFNKNIKNIEIIKSSHRKLEEIINQNGDTLQKIREQQNNYNNELKKYENDIKIYIDKQVKGENEINDLKNNIISENNELRICLNQ